MTPKQRVIKAIKFERTDVLPVWLDFLSDEFIDKYKERAEGLKDKYHSDIILVHYKPPKELREKYDKYCFSLPIKKGKHLFREDEFGVIYEKSSGQGFQVHKSPLLNWSDFDNFVNNLPDANAEERFDEVKKIVDNNKDKYIFGLWWYGFFERMWTLRGMENLFYDLIENKGKVKSLGNILLEFFKALVKNFKESGVDGIFFSDDWGSQNALLISPKVWHEIFRPLYKELFTYIHKLGMDICLHSCGNIIDIIKPLKEDGLDIIHPLQPGIMDSKITSKICREIKLCILSGIDVQYHLPKFSGKELIEQVVNTIEIFGGKSGGFILAYTNLVQSDVDIIEIERLYNSIYSKYRKIK